MRQNNVTFSKTVCVCVQVYVVYEDTNVYNDMGITQVLQGEGDFTVSPYFKRRNHTE